MTHIMAGKMIAFKIEPSQGNNSGYSLGRSISDLGFFPSGYSSFFITNDNDSTYLGTMFGSAGGYSFANASAFSVYNNIDNIIWSSWHFDYFEHLVSSEADNVTMPSYPVQFSGGKDSFNIPYTQTANHDIVSFSSLAQTFSYPPLFTLKSSTYPTIGNQLVLKYGSDSYRILTPFATTTELAIRELVYVGNTAIPSENLGTIGYHLINTGSDASLSHNVDTNDLLINDSRVKIGTGKKAFNNQQVLFDSENDYLQKSSSGDIEFYTETQIGSIIGSDSYSAGDENNFSSFAQTNDVTPPIPMTHDPDRWNVVVFINKNGSVVFSESAKYSPSITHKFQASSDISLLGNFQGNVVKYEI